MKSKKAIKLSENALRLEQTIRGCFNSNIPTEEDISKMAEEDEYFQGFVINPHSQNFNMDRNGSF